MVREKTTYTVHLTVTIDVEHEHDESPEWDVVAKATQRALKGRAIRLPGGTVFPDGIHIDEAEDGAEDV